MQEKKGHGKYSTYRPDDLCFLAFLPHQLCDFLLYAGQGGVNNNTNNCMRGCPDNRVTRFWQSCHYKVVKHINIGIRIPGSSQSCHSILAMILLDLDSRVTRCEHVSVLIADNTLIRLAPAIFVSTSEKSKNKIKCILISIYNYIYMNLYELIKLISLLAASTAKTQLLLSNLNFFHRDAK